MHNTCCIYHHVCMCVRKETFPGRRKSIQAGHKHGHSSRSSLQSSSYRRHTVLIYDLYLILVTIILWCSFSELAYQTLMMMILLDVRMPSACLEYFPSFDIIFACYYNSYIFWDTILSVVYQKCAVGGRI